MSDLQVPSEFRWIPHEPSPKQQMFLRLTCREALYGGSAGCGKSDALLMAALQGIHIPTYSAILFRRTYSDLRLSGALMDRARTWWDRSPAKWSSNDKTWTFPSGARIGFGYLESEAHLARYQSAEFQMIGFDEESQFTGSQITYMFSRLRRTTEFPHQFPLRVRGATNPGGIGHKFLVYRYRIPTDRGAAPNAPPIVIRDPNDPGRVLRVFVPAHATDNPGLDWADYELSLSELTEVRRKQLRDGLWVEDSSGLVYGSAQSATYVEVLPAGHKWHYVLAIDLGATNNCAFAIYAIADDLEEIYLLSTSEPPGLNTPRDVATHVKALEEIYHFDRIVGDHGALGKGYLEEMRRYFQIPIQNCEKTNKRGYIGLFNGALENGTVRIVRSGCATWIDQTEHLLWKDDRRLEEMPGMPNHSCDVGLYGWREAKHYTFDTKEESPHSDPIEERETDNAFASEEDFNATGVSLPGYYR
jgi:hypothetical protein